MKQKHVIARPEGARRLSAAKKCPWGAISRYELHPSCCFKKEYALPGDCRVGLPSPHNDKFFLCAKPNTCINSSFLPPVMALKRPSWENPGSPADRFVQSEVILIEKNTNNMEIFSFLHFTTGKGYCIIESFGKYRFSRKPCIPTANAVNTIF